MNKTTETTYELTRAICECGHPRSHHQHWDDGEPDDCFGNDGKCECGKFWDPIVKADYDESKYYY